MNISGLIICILICFFLSFGCLRFYIDRIKRYELNLSAYKKRKKGETLKEWLLYSRYKEEIPKIFLRFYYTVPLVHIISIMSCLVVHIASFPVSVAVMIVKIVYLFDGLWIIGLKILLYTPPDNSSNKSLYKRWFKR